jgi:hypothetical protein
MSSMPGSFKKLGPEHHQDLGLRINLAVIAEQREQERAREKADLEVETEEDVNILHLVEH